MSSGSTECTWRGLRSSMGALNIFVDTSAVRRLWQLSKFERVRHFPWFNKAQNFQLLLHAFKEEFGLPRCLCSFERSLYTFSYMLERRENQDLLFGDHDDRLSVSFIRSLPSWLFRVARSSPNRAVSGLSPHKQTRAAGRTEKKPSFQRKTAQCSKLPVFYFRIAKTATPTQFRTALNSSEKSTERLKSNSQLRHNCPNTMRK